MQQQQLYKKIFICFLLMAKKEIETHIINHQKKPVLIAKHCQLHHWCKISVHTKQAGNINTNDFLSIMNVDIFNQLLEKYASKRTKASHLLMQRKFHRSSYRKLRGYTIT